MASPVPISSNFPKGLRVLLVDEDLSRGYVEAQLRGPDLSYAVTACGSTAEALSYCRAGVSSFDVVLAEARLVAPDEAAGRAFIESFEETPVILMSECSTTGDVLRAVKLGAVDWLDKPLSVLKLRNIWQHSVRRIMQRSSLPYEAACGEKPATSARSKRSASALDCCPPSTPTVADSGEMDTVSAVSFGSMKDVKEYSFGGGAEPMRTSFDSCDASKGSYGGGSGAAQQAQQQARPPMAVKPSSFGPLVPVPPPSQWPQLQPGCVWGTPVGGPLAPPPLPVPQAGAAPPQVPFCPPSAFLPSTSHLSLSSLMEEDTHVSLPCSLPSVASTDSVSIPQGFFEKDNARSERGPIGLKLKKSNSLLNLINAALTCSTAC